MSRDSRSITLDFHANMSPLLQEMSKELSKIKSTGVSSAVNKDIDKIEAEISELSKAIDEVSNKKVNTSTFANFEKNIIARVEAVEKEINNLVNTSKTLLDTLSSADKSDFDSFLNKIKSSLEQVVQITNTTADSLKSLGNVSIETTGLQNLLSLLKEFQKIEDEEVGISVNYESFDEYKKQLILLFNQLNQTYKKIKSIDTSTDIGKIDEAKLKNEFAAKAQLFNALYEQASNKFGDSGFSKRLTKDEERTLISLSNSVNKWMSNLSRNVADNIESIREKLNDLKAESLKDDPTKERGSIPVKLSPKAFTSLKNQIKELLDRIQPWLMDNPIEVPLSMTTEWGTRKQNELLKQFQAQIDSLSSETDMSEFQKLIDKIEESFGTQIEIKYKSYFDDEVKAVRAGISALREEVKNKFEINPTFKIKDSQFNKIKEQLEELSPTIDVSNDSKNISELRSSNDLLLGLTRIQTQLERITTNNYSGITELKEEVSVLIDSVKAIQESNNVELDGNKTVEGLKNYTFISQGFTRIYTQLERILSNESSSVSEIQNQLSLIANNTGDLLKTSLYLDQTGHNTRVKQIGKLDESKGEASLVKIKDPSSIKDIRDFNNSISRSKEELDGFIKTIADGVGNDDSFSRAIQEYILEMEQLGDASSETAKKIKDAISITKKNDSAGSSLELLSDLYDSQYNNKRGIGKEKQVLKLDKEILKTEQEIQNLRNNNLDSASSEKIIDLKKRQRDQLLSELNYDPKGELSQNLTQQRELNQELIKETNHRNVNLALLREMAKVADAEDNLKSLDISKYSEEINENLSLIIDKIQLIKETGIIPDNFWKEYNSFLEQLDESAIASPEKISSTYAELARVLDENTYAPKAIREELEGLIAQVKSGGDITESELSRVRVRMNEIKGTIHDLGVSGNSFFSSISKASRQASAQFIARFLSFQDIVRYIREAAQAVIQLDTNLTELRKVSDATTSRLQQSFEKSAETAKELGSTISDVIKITSDWARLGYNVDQAEDLARVTTLFTTVGDNMTADDASSYLISTLQGFQLAADQSEEIVDKYNEVANNFAIDTRGIGEALQRSAASFNSANTSLSESIALITATNEVIQNPESVGTLWKTLSARIRGAKTELADLGEEEDEFTQTTSKLRDLVKSLTGFDIMEDEKTFKSIYQIILGIGKEWDKLTDIERASLGEALAGKRNSNALLAVLGNLDHLQEAYAAAEDAAGSAAREQRNYEQSIQYSVDRFRAALEELEYDALDTDFVKNLVEGAAKFLEILDKIVEKLGGLVPTLTAIGATQIITHWDKLKVAMEGFAKIGASYDAAGFTGVKFLKQLGEEATGTSKKVGVLTDEMLEQQGATLGLTSSFKGLFATLLSNPITYVVAALAAVGYAVYEVNEATKEMKNLVRETTAEYLNDKRDLEAYETEVVSLKETLNDSSATYEEAKAARERLMEIQDALIEKYGQEKGAIEKLDAISWNKRLNEINSDKDLKKRFRNSLEGDSNNVEAMIREYTNSYREMNFANEKLAEQLAETYDSVSLVYGGKNGDQLMGLGFKGNLEDVYADLLNIQALMYDMGHSDYGDMFGGVASNIEKDLTDLKDFANEYYLQENIFKDSDMTELYRSYIDSVEDYREALADGDEAKIEEFKEQAISDYNEFKTLVMNDDTLEPGVARSLIRVFEDINPTLTFEINKQDLINQLEEVIDGEKTKGEQLKESISLFESEDQLFNFKLEEGDTSALAQAYKFIDETARAAGYSVEDLYRVLQETSDLLNDTRLRGRDTDMSASAYLNTVSPDRTGGNYERRVSNMFDRLSGSTKEIIKLFGADEWNQVNVELERLYGTTDLSRIKGNQLAVAVDKVAESFERAKEAEDDSADSLQEWNKYLSETLEKIGMAKEDFDKYVVTLKEMNPEFINNQEEAEKCALANQLFSNAVEDLQSNWETYKENLNDATRETPEFNETIRTLSEDLEYLTGIDFSVTDTAKFLEDETNFNNLEKAIQGDDEALQALQATASQLDLFSIDDFNLDMLDNGGAVDLTLRPIIDSKALADAGYEVEESAGELATVFTTTFSNAAGDIAINFTPILPDGTVMEKGEFDKYCQDVVNGVREDDLKLQIGAEFTGEDAIDEAVNAAERIHQMHDLALSVNMDLDDFNNQFVSLVDWMNSVDLGTIDVGTFIDEQPFLAGIADIVKTGGDAATQLQSVFKALGWNLKWDMTDIKVPDFSAMQIPQQEYAKAAAKNKAAGKGYTVKGVTYKTVKSPTNIRFENSGGAGSKSRTPYADYVPKSIKAPSNTNKGGGGGGGGGKGGPSSDSENSANEQEDTYDELFDYFERRLDVLNNAAELLDKNLENVVGSMAKNTLLDAKGGILKEQMNNYEDALNMYQQKADEAFNKLPADIQARIKDGAVALTEFIGQGNEEVVEAMNDYKNWADKVDDVKQNLAELKETLRQLELQKFNNIVEDFTQQFDLRQSNGIDLIKDQIELFESAGQVIGEAFYREQANQTNKQLDILNREKEALVNQMNSALMNGVDRGSEEWLEMVNALTEVDSKILEAKTSLEEFDNAILQLHVDMFERVQTTFSNYHDELEDIRSLIESADEDVATKDNAWTSTGLAQLGTLAQQYEMASYQVRQYDDEIALLNQQYLEGRYSATEYADRLADLMGKQRDAAQQTESIKDSMMELNKARVEIVVEGINEEIEAYEKLITAQKDTLSAEKDLHDYRKSIEESNKSITDIQKQLAAISNDDSQKARAQRAKLQQQLSEAQEALEEKEYSHSIETQQQALDDQLTAYKDSRNKEIEELQATLEDRELMISQSFEVVRANAEQIGITIRDTALTHGIEVSTALTDAWNAGSNAIGAYGAALNAGSSQFMTNITNVESDVYSLQDQANQTATALANMYAVNADNLVAQLTNSYSAESNMKAMTDALGQSMINVLDRGYAIDSISKMFDNAATSAENLARSASNAASSIKSMYEAASSPTSPSTPQKTGPYTHQGGINTNSSKVAADEGGLVTVRDKNGNIVEITTKEKAKKKYGSKGLYGYASGYSSIPKNQLAWTQEKGQELIISPSDGSVLTRLNRGDTVFSAEQTRKLWELSKMNLPNIAGGILKDFKLPTSGLVTANTMQVGSLIEVNGNVNDSMDMLKIAAQEASKQIGSSFKQLNEGLHK